jgi:hypothetical protein
MSRYSGETSFEFEIERYKSRESGKFFASEAVPTDDDFEYEYQLIMLQVEGRSYFESGRYSGPAENCYPDEGETEITLVKGPDGKDWEDQLTESEKDSIIEKIQEEVIDSSDGPDPDDYMDDYDRDY